MSLKTRSNSHLNTAFGGRADGDGELSERSNGIEEESEDENTDWKKVTSAEDEGSDVVGEPAAQTSRPRPNLAPPH